MATATRAAGTALGGFYERGELAEWLARRFAPQLAERKLRLHAEEQHTVAATGTASRVMTMRSALHDSNPTSLVSRDVAFTGGTERLPLPAHERLTSSQYFGGEQLAPRTRQRPRTLVIAAAAIVMLGIVATIFAMTRTPDRPARETAQTAAVHLQPTTQPPADPPAPAATPAAPVEPPPPVDAPPPVRPRPAHAPKVAKPKARVEPKVVEARGMLTVDSNPYAVIQVDGASIGTTPLFKVSVPAGKHKLRATDPSGRAQVRTITVEDGKEARVRLDWSEP